MSLLAGINQKVYTLSLLNLISYKYIRMMTSKIMSLPQLISLSFTIFLNIKYDIYINYRNLLLLLLSIPFPQL